MIKRRWAIVSKAGGGAAVLAIAGALALGDPNDQTDFGQDAGGAELAALLRVLTGLRRPG